MPLSVAMQMVISVRGVNCTARTPLPQILRVHRVRARWAFGFHRRWGDALAKVCSGYGYSIGPMCTLWAHWFGRSRYRFLYILKIWYIQIIFNDMRWHSAIGIPPRKRRPFDFGLRNPGSCRNPKKPRATSFRMNFCSEKVYWVYWLMIISKAGLHFAWSFVCIDKLINW